MRLRLLVDVDVQRPVRPRELLRHRLRGRRRGSRCGVLRPAAARGEQPRHRQQRTARDTAAQQLFTVVRLGHLVQPSSARETTNVDSGANDSSIRSPGACDPAPWTYTETSPTGVRTTYCVETPTYALSTISPASLFAPPPPILSFSGRMP